jgi:hypothetical protein
MTNESIKWAVIPRLPDHEIGDAGHVRRLRQSGNWIAGKVLRAHLAGKGYLTVAIRGKKYAVHRLVCEAFNGPPPFEGAMVRHLNDQKQDNRPENLAWGTMKDNAADARRNGKMARPVLRFSRDEAARLRAEGLTYRQVAERLGVTHVAVIYALRACPVQDSNLRFVLTKDAS